MVQFLWPHCCNPVILSLADLELRQQDFLARQNQPPVFVLTGLTSVLFFTSRSQLTLDMLLPRHLLCASLEYLALLYSRLLLVLISLEIALARLIMPLILLLLLLREKSARKAFSQLNLRIYATII